MNTDDSLIRMGGQHIHDTAAKLDHAKRTILAAWFFEISAEAVDQARETRKESTNA